jgi:hypothetical protein
METSKVWWRQDLDELFDCIILVRSMTVGFWTVYDPGFKLCIYLTVCIQTHTYIYRKTKITYNLERRE